MKSSAATEKRRTICPRHALGMGARLVAALLAIVVLSGCQQMQRIFHAPSTVSTVAQSPACSSQPVARLAAFAPMSAEPSADREFTQPGESVTNVDSSATAIDTNGVAAYTAPKFALVPIITLATQFGRFDVRADANVARADALVSGAGGIVGRAGVTGQTATLGATLVSRPGLLEGPATGLSFASPDRNIFVRQTNPLSGPNGACAELSRAGFFGGNRGACERTRRR